MYCALVQFQGTFILLEYIHFLKFIVVNFPEEKKKIYIYNTGFEYLNQLAVGLF